MPSWLVPLLVAPFIGSFLGVLIRRLPARRPVVAGRSACEGCGRVLAIRDLLPVVSYALLRGRCRTCGARIAAQHLAVELLALVVAAMCVWTQPDVARIWAGCVLGWGLLALGWIDWDHLRLPDPITLPLIPLGLVATLVLEPEEIAGHAAAASLGYAAFRIIAWLYRRWRGREGLGQGDAKLLAAAGAWVGLARLSDVVVIGALLGLGVPALRAMQGRTWHADTPIPFGPGLCLAIWLVWLVSDPLTIR